MPGAATQYRDGSKAATKRRGGAGERRWGSGAAMGAAALAMGRTYGYGGCCGGHGNTRQQHHLRLSAHIPFLTTIVLGDDLPNR